MIERKYVTRYARDSGVDELIAERDVVLTYLLHYIQGPLLPNLAFKGGTCLKKTYFGREGRFSMDLDFTAIEKTSQEIQQMCRDTVNDKTYFDIHFQITDENVKDESYFASVKYQHTWNEGDFELNISCREEPIFGLEKKSIIEESYLTHTEITPFMIPCLVKEELLSEKIRASYQRTRPRDLYDLYLFSDRPFNKELVKKSIIIKFWNVHDLFEPKKYFEKISADRDFTELESFVNHEKIPQKNKLIKAITQRYSFLNTIETPLDEIRLDYRPHKKQAEVRKLIETMRN